MPRSRSQGSWLAFGTLALAIVGSLILTLLAIFYYAPREETMGDAQRIVYVHVAVAWCSLAGCIAMGAASVGYMSRSTPAWDQRAQAAAEIGWLCSTLTLATGSLWAHVAWGTWWTWDPRLTTSLILWILYAGYFLVRAGSDDPRRRARSSAVLAVLALADVPLIILATRWFRGMHPVTPDMDPRMRTVLWMSILSFSTLFLALGILRRRQLAFASRVAHLEFEYRSSRSCPT